MPIPATRDQVETGQPAPAPIPPQPMAWGHTYVSITGSNGQGEEIPLTGFSDRRWPTYLLQAGATGLDMPPVELHADASPNLDGSIFRSARFSQREVLLPLYLYGIDRRTLRDLKRKLTQALNPKNGYCVLKIVEGDGQPRYLYCYYKGGMEGSETTDNAGFRWARFGIQLTAFDPWYYSDELHVAQWSFGGNSPFLKSGAAFMPLDLNLGVLSGANVPVVNPGDVDAWPIWELKGPIKSFTFTSPTGESFGISADPGGLDRVADGRTLTVDTRPGYKTLKDDQGANYWPFLAANPSLWPVPTGRSSIGITVVAGAGNASLKLTLRPRYESY